MNKLDILKKLGRAGLNLAGVQAGAGNDKVRALEAEKELLDLKLALAVDALKDVQATIIEASRLLPPAPENVLTSGQLVIAAHDTQEALDVLGRAE